MTGTDFPVTYDSKSGFQSSHVALPQELLEIQNQALLIPGPTLKTNKQKLKQTKNPNLFIEILVLINCIVITKII